MFFSSAFHLYRSLFDKYPEVRDKYFLALLQSSTDVRGTLEKHGAKVVNAIGSLVSALNAKDDGKLVSIIRQVRHG